MLERLFGLSEHKTTVRTELLAGLTTFLTMAYIIFLQPAVLSGRMFGIDTGMDAGAVMTATCLTAALATAVMAFYARYPIAQAPGMGENFFFVTSVLPAAATLIAAQVKAGAIEADSTEPWRIGLGVVFIAGILFLLLSLCGVQKLLLETISPSMRNAIAVGIGLFIAFIGLQSAGLVVHTEGTCVKLNPQFTSPDLIVFFFGLLLTAALHGLRVRGSIVWGILAATLLALVLKLGLPLLPGPISESPVVTGSTLMAPPEEGGLKIADRVVSAPPSMAPTFFRMDLLGALSLQMVPFILIFLFMDVFDTLGTLIGVGEQAGLIKGNELPRAREALVSDAIGTVAGAALGTSTVTSFIESTAGVQQGGRTGLTALCTAFLFLVALLFYPIVEMIGEYRPITAPALVVVGSMMMWNVTKIDWSDYTEAMPSFLIVIGIPMTYSIGDGLALGFVAYPIIKLCTGRGRRVNWLMYAMALVLAAYLVLIRVRAG